MKIVKEEQDVVLYATLAEIHEMVTSWNFGELVSEEDRPTRLRIVGESEETLSPSGKKTIEARTFEVVFTQFFSELEHVDGVFHEMFGCVEGE